MFYRIDERYLVVVVLTELDRFFPFTIVLEVRGLQKAERVVLLRVSDFAFVYVFAHSEKVW